MKLFKRRYKNHFWNDSVRYKIRCYKIICPVSIFFEPSSFEDHSSVYTTHWLIQHILSISSAQLMPIAFSHGNLMPCPEILRVTTPKLSALIIERFHTGLRIQRHRDWGDSVMKYRWSEDMAVYLNFCGSLWHCFLAFLSK